MHRSLPWAVAVAITFAAGCAEPAVAPLPRPTPATPASADDPCNPLLQVCEPGPSEGATRTWPFFGPYGDPIYEAAGDPSPGAPGIWLGATVTPATCFNDRTRNIVDLDQDWLDDRCELELARGFAPRWRMAANDGCPDGEPMWAAKYFPAVQQVRLGFLPAYYDDCGHGIFGTANSGGAHNGDSEFVTVDIVFNASTQHWEFQRMWLSAHYEASILGISGDRSSWQSRSSTVFSRRYLAHPSVEVSIAKHANYKDYGVCMQTVASQADLFGDQCNSVDITDAFRFPIDPTRNVGSGWRPFPIAGSTSGCFTSIKRYAGLNTWECPWSATGTFRGWHPTTESYGSAMRYRGLLDSDKFDYWRPELTVAVRPGDIFAPGDRGPGPAPAVLLRVSISGPSWVSYPSNVTWSASPLNCNPGCTYQWRYFANGYWSTLGTGQSQVLNVGPALGPSFTMEVTAYTNPGEVAIATITVTNDTYAPPPPCDATTCDPPLMLKVAPTTPGSRSAGTMLAPPRQRAVAKRAAERRKS